MGSNKRKVTSATVKKENLLPQKLSETEKWNIFIDKYVKQINCFLDTLDSPYEAGFVKVVSSLGYTRNSFIELVCKMAFDLIKNYSDKESPNLEIFLKKNEPFDTVESGSDLAKELMKNRQISEEVLNNLDNFIKYYSLVSEVQFLWSTTHAENIVADEHTIKVAELLPAWLDKYKKTYLSIPRKTNPESEKLLQELEEKSKVFFRSFQKPVKLYYWTKGEPSLQKLHDLLHKAKHIEENPVSYGFGQDFPLAISNTFSVDVPENSSSGKYGALSLEELKRLKQEAVEAEDYDKAAELKKEIESRN